MFAPPTVVYAVQCRDRCTTRYFARDPKSGAKIEINIHNGVVVVEVDYSGSRQTYLS